jgi:type I restriction enzyme S subunit
VEEGDFVYNRLFAWKGSFAIANTSNHNCYVSNEFPAFIIEQAKIDARYLWRYFSRESAWSEILGLSSGSTPASRNRLKEEKLLAMEIPLPPLEEQRRIVARIEEVAAKIEEARGLRQAIKKEIQALKGSYMNYIFSSLKTQGSFYCSLGEIADIRAGVTLGRVLQGSTISIPYLRVANVQDGKLDLSVIKEIDILPEELKKWKLEDGDILLTEGGDWDKLGRGTVWKGEIPICIHQNHIFRLRIMQKDFDVNFLAAYISSPYGKTYFQSAAKKTTNLASINQKQLKALKIIKPPLEIQKEIVVQLGMLQAKIDILKRHQAETSAELNALLPSILDKAFKGEL